MKATTKTTPAETRTSVEFSRDDVIKALTEYAARQGKYVPRGETWLHVNDERLRDSLSYTARITVYHAADGEST